MTSSISNNTTLNFDILTKIFEQFFICSQTEDIKISHTLFTCTLVNKQWCESALPLLWRDPFQFTREDSPSNDKAGELVATLLTCLTREECQQFFTSIKGHIPKIISLPPLYRRRPYFNYPNYVKHLHTEGMINSALSWFKNTYPCGNVSGPSSNISTSNSSATLNRINSNISLNRSNSSLSINNDTSKDKIEKKLFVEQIIECLLQMFVDRNVCFKNVYVKDVKENRIDFTRGFFKNQFVKSFNQIQKLDILEMGISKYSDMLNVWKDFSNLTSLSIKMEYPIDSHYSNLSQILQSTNVKKHLRKLKLDSGETKHILPLLSPKYSSIQHLIFVNIAFDTSDAWHLLSNFTQLRKMKLIQCWFKSTLDDDSKQKMFSIITQMQFNHLKLFVCVTNEVNIEDDAKSELVLWGVQQHAIVALENPGLENVRIYHESMMGGLQVDAVKHHRYTSYMREIKKSLKINS